MKYITIIIAALLATSCATTKQIPINNQEVVKTEIKEVLKDTTIYVTLEKEVVKEIIKNPQDTTSTLSTKYATSTAKLENGTLHHQLKNKVDSIPTKVIYKDIIKVDSIYVKKEIPVDVPVPIRDNIFWISIIGNIVFILLLVFRLYLKFR